MQLNPYLVFNGKCREAFGMLTDRFGIPWIINCSRPA